MVSLFSKLYDRSPHHLFSKSAAGLGAMIFKKNSQRPDNPLGARMSDAAYDCGRTGEVNDECIKTANEKLSGTGYAMIPELSTPTIATFKDNEGNYGIAHRGTCTSCPDAKKDLAADSGIVFGYNTDMNRTRLTQTEELVRKIKEKDPNSNVTLQGHSLGGQTSTYVMGNSPFLQDNIDQLNTYNIGQSFLSNQVKYNFDDDTKAMLNKKTTHYRKRGDNVSAGAVSNTPFGETKNYPSPIFAFPVAATFKEHNITNFYDGNIKYV